jgi:co-chaperonin GroES (HSP10)
MVAIFLCNIQKILKFELIMSITPVNKALITIKSAFVDEITTKSGFKFYIDPSYNKEFQAASVGTITHVSTWNIPENQEIASSLKTGDEIVMSYRVVAQFTFEGDGDKFIDLNPDGSNTFKKFSNGRGEWLIIRALPKSIGKVWVGVHTNKFGLVDGVQGDESDVERWLSKFPLGKSDRYKFDNLVEINGKDYWKVNYSEIFAKIKGEKIVALGDRIICEPLEMDISDNLQAMYGIEIPMSAMKVRWQDRAKVVSGCRKLGLKKGDIIGFDPKYLEKYDIKGKEYYIIKQRRVDGIWTL